MKSVLVLEKDPRRAIILAKSLAPLGLSLHSIACPSEIDRSVQDQNVLAIVIRRPEDRYQVGKSVGLNSKNAIPILTYRSYATIKRKLCAVQLTARCANFVKRAPSSLSLRSGGVIDAPSRQLLLAPDVRIGLSKTELVILMLFAMNEEKIVYKNDILNELWGRCDPSAARSLDAHMFVLRKKLDSSGYPLKISSVPRIGFFSRSNAKMADDHIERRNSSHH